MTSDGYNFASLTCTLWPSYFQHSKKSLATTSRQLLPDKFSQHEMMLTLSPTISGEKNWKRACVLAGDGHFLTGLVALLANFANLTRYSRQPVVFLEQFTFWMWNKITAIRRTSSLFIKVRSDIYQVRRTTSRVAYVKLKLVYFGPS